MKRTLKGDPNLENSRFRVYGFRVLVSGCRLHRVYRVSGFRALNSGLGFIGFRVYRV